MYSMPVRTVWTFFTSPVMQWPAYMLPRVASSQPGTKMGRFFCSGGQQPAVLGIDLVGRFKIAGEQNLVHELVREEALAGLVGADPFLEHFVLDAAHGLHLGDAGVGDAVHVAGEQLGFVGGGEVAVVGHALVEVVRDEVEDVFFEIRAGAADAVNLVLADHFGERKAELGCAHGAADGDEHFSAGGEVLVVGFGGVDEGGSVEMAIVVLDKRSNCRHDLCETPVPKLTQMNQCKMNAQGRAGSGLCVQARAEPSEKDLGFGGWSAGPAFWSCLGSL